MALEQIKEWNDSASAREIAELAKTPNKCIVVVVGREVRLLVMIAHQICALYAGDSGFVLYTPKCEIRFANGSKVQFHTTRNVAACSLRGMPRLDAAYLVDSFTWQLIEQDTVRCELAPLLGRK